MIPAVPDSSGYTSYYAETVRSGGHGSFTQTFLRGILASIDSKDPVVAHAWLETLLDAIDLLPEDVVRREVVPIAISKAQMGESVFGRQASCRLLGKIALKLDGPAVRSAVLPTALSLGQDGDPEVRFTLTTHLPLIAKGAGLEATKDAILPQLVELSVDDSPCVVLAALDTTLQLLPLLDEPAKSSVILPLLVKLCERARASEENPLLPNIAHVFGRLLHGLQAHFHPDQAHWGLNFFKSLCKSGLGPPHSPSRAHSASMPDIVPVSEDKVLMHARVRKECALNLSAMTTLIGPDNFEEYLFQSFADLVKDGSPAVRAAVARSIQDLAPILGHRLSSLETQLCALFSDGSLLTLEAMVRSMVEVVDILARSGNGKGRGSPINFSGEISSALLSCESVISKTRNWRLHADCLEKFSCLANCISPTTILNKFVPTLFERIHRTRTLPCKVAASRTLLVFLRFTVRSEDRKFILFRMKEELARGKSCSSRMLFLKVGYLSMSLFSKAYFKLHFFSDMIRLHGDPVPNVRLKLVSLLPKLKALLSLPSDRELLLNLEDAVKKLLLVERDRDVLYALQTVIQELDSTDPGVDGLPGGNPEDERDNDRKLREERLISNMEEQIHKMHKEILDSGKIFPHGTIRKRSESVPRDIILSPPKELEKRFPDVEKHSHTIMGNEDRSFYSASLENLDPSAKEFLVDAGITLDIRKNESLPNLSNLKPEEPVFPQFLRSQHHFQDPPTLREQGVVRRAETPIVPTETSSNTEEPFRPQLIKSSFDSSPQKSPPKGSSLESKLRPPSKLKPPSSSNLPSPSSSSSSSSSTPSTNSSTLLDISAIAQNTLSRIPYSKLVSSTDRIQGSIERLAEKWESKRRNLSNNAQQSEVIPPPSSKLSSIPSKRNSLLFSNKQKMRLSLTDVTNSSHSSSSSSSSSTATSPKDPPPPQKSHDIVEEDMVTYVPPLSTSQSTVSQKAKLVTATNLVVKPLNSTPMTTSSPISSSSSTHTTPVHQRSLPVPSLKYVGAIKRPTIQSSSSRPKSSPLSVNSIPKANNSSSSSSIPHYSGSGGGSSNSINTTTTNSNSTHIVPKFSRVPPPKYRNPPNTSRRPLSQQEPGLRPYSQMGTRYDESRRQPRNSQGKSLSAECILDRSDPETTSTTHFSSPNSNGSINNGGVYNNTTPRFKKPERLRYGGLRRQSRSPSPVEPRVLKENPSRYADRRPETSRLQAPQTPFMNGSRRKSSSVYHSNPHSSVIVNGNGSLPKPSTHSQPQQQQLWNKTIPSPRSIPLGSKSKGSNPGGIPTPGFSRLPVGASSYVAHK